VLSLAIYAIAATVRFFAFLSPYSLQEIFFLQTVLLWALPFIFLTPAGRRQIGLHEAGVGLRSLLLSALAGSVCGFGMFATGNVLYGDSPNNWGVSIRNYIHIDDMRGVIPPLAIFALYALPAMFLNPIAEEILFRGLMQEAFKRRFNAGVATAVNALLFAAVYLSVHGIWSDATGFHLRAGSAAVAILLMMCVGCVFTLCRILSGSLWPAMAAHAAFNLTMVAVAIHRFDR